MSLILLSLPLSSLLSPVKDESAINTPAVAAAFAIKAYQAQDDSEISLEVSHSPTHLFLLLWLFFGCLNFSLCILYSYFSLNMLDKSCIASLTKHFLRHPSSWCPTKSATEERQPFICNSLNLNSLTYSKPLFLIKVVHILVFASCLTLFHLLICHSFSTIYCTTTLLLIPSSLSFRVMICQFYLVSLQSVVVLFLTMRWTLFLSFVSCFAYSSWKVVIKKGHQDTVCVRVTDRSFFAFIFLLALLSYGRRFLDWHFVACQTYLFILMMKKRLPRESTFADTHFKQRDKKETMNDADSSNNILICLFLYQLLFLSVCLIIVPSTTVIMNWIILI